MLEHPSALIGSQAMQVPPLVPQDPTARA